MRVRFATFNIRNGRGLDLHNAWPFRRPATAAAIAALDADVVGLQEVFEFQRRYLRRQLPELDWCGQGRDGDRAGEQCPVLVRRHPSRPPPPSQEPSPALTVLREHTWWYGPTPAVAGSRLPGASFPRIATVVRCRTVSGSAREPRPSTPGSAREPRRSASDSAREPRRSASDSAREPRRSASDSARELRRSASDSARELRRTADVEFDVVNTHLDERVAANRAASVRQLVEWLDPAVPTAVLGDFNAPDTDTAVLGPLTEAGFQLAPVTGGTCHNFTGAADGPRIDHIFLSPHWSVEDAGVVRERPGGRLPSDHWPVRVTARVHTGTAG